MSFIDLCGRSTFVLPDAVHLIGTGTAVGKMEGQGPLGQEFDIINYESSLGEDTFEKAERKLLEQSCNAALAKTGLKGSDIDLFFAGDLMNQIISASFAARELAIPYIGLFGACSTSMLSLGLAALAVRSCNVRYAMAATCSHNNTVEKQFRYPNEYGAQKCQTAQSTATAAGAAIVANKCSKNVPRISAVTFGRVIDRGIKDPFNMGAAMAPAACDTIVRHLDERGIDADYYDLIVTGDLGKIGHKILIPLLAEQKIKVSNDKFRDCGMLLYGDDKNVIAGGSGCGCCAAVTFGYLYHLLALGQLKKVLVVATGALLSPLSYQQKESIPGVAHAVAFEGRDE